jgi:tRNA-splicing ligase RtcB
MYKFKNEGMKVPCYVWAEEGAIEQGAIDQIINASSLPFAFHHTVLCPDAHQGYGAPIGGVMATDGVVIPFFVGVDIGCGMCAIKTSLTRIDTDTLKKIISQIRQEIPVGMNKHKEAQPDELMPALTITSSSMDTGRIPIRVKDYTNAKKSLGTLGGGNHFIEIQMGSDGFIWVMIHSGSRNLGKQVAEHYNDLAKKLNAKWRSIVDVKVDLAFLPIASDEGAMYMKEMQYCVDFALANRKHMMNKVIEIFTRTINPFSNITADTYNVGMINIAHNYAKIENHFQKNVIVHRKGATLADTDTIGIIPGSQGTKSYIVKGKGNEQSFRSCSHGAGRKMGRKDAERRLDLVEEIKKLDDQGIIHGIRGKADLDEASGAYKDIDVVMKNQEDLVEILVELTPLGVVKG